MIENNKVESISYEVADANTKEVIDKSKDGQPLEFITGCNQVIEGLEAKILESNLGDVLSFSVEPEKGYGLHNPQLIQELDRAQFSDIDLQKGMTLFGQAEDGMPVQVIVADFNDSSVMIDYNHPLAGKTLEFKVNVLSVRDATTDELMIGLGGGCGRDRKSVV